MAALIYCAKILQDMTGKEFLNKVTNGETDVIQELLSILEKTGSDYCLIGGIAVNAYAEPVVSLDLDLVVAADQTEKICDEAQKREFRLEKFEHSINLTCPKSDLRIQLQTDSRYQEFISRASIRNVLGYEIKVAALQDLIQGKIWAYSDPKRRRSKKQKDLADIARLVETFPDIESKLPAFIRNALG